MKLLGFLMAVAAFAQSGPVTVKSPDGAVELRIAAGQQFTYEVSYKGKPVITRSILGVELQDKGVLGPGLAIASSTPSQVDETYPMPAGKANPIRDRCSAISVDLKKLVLEARAYNDGVAFRYRIPEQEGGSSLRIVNERTQFAFAKEGTAYPLVLRNYRTSWEDNYHALPLGAIAPEWLVAMPLLVELPGTGAVAVTEAAIENYSGMYLKHSARDARTMEARLSPRLDDAAVSVITPAPALTPWRVILVADEAGKLIESNMITSLNPPSKIADTSWIKPGKASWDWWSGPYAEGLKGKPGKNTETIKHYIDFSARSGFEYFMLDAGWAVVTKGGPSDSGVDLTKVKPEIDMPGVLAYAKSKNVKLWLWAHWTDIDRQMEDAFPLYEKWGIAGVKIDFMDRDDQQMVEFYRKVAKLAADHHLMVDFHGAYKPDGIERTWPNVVTREGVLGLEYNKWSARVTPEHNVMLAFTRLIAGPMDYTPGGFHNATREQFVPRNEQPMVMTTRAHQLGLFVVYYSPFEMVSDHPEAYAGTKELAFLTAVPAAWDETRYVTGKVGEYIAVARRKGNDWYVGAISGRDAAEIEVPLNFLSSGTYTAEIYADAPDADRIPTSTTVETKPVTQSTRLRVKMAPGGGQAMRIRPTR